MKREAYQLVREIDLLDLSLEEAIKALKEYANDKQFNEDLRKAGH